MIYIYFQIVIPFKTLCMLGYFHDLFCPLLTLFKIVVFFSKKIFHNTTSVSNSLDPDQARRSVGPDLGPNCSQISSRQDYWPLTGEELNN